jgi:hypothetical protein
MFSKRFFIAILLSSVSHFVAIFEPGSLFVNKPVSEP